VSKKPAVLADFDHLSGDELDGVVAWRDKSDLAELKEKTHLHLHLHMARTHLFALSLRANRPTNPSGQPRTLDGTGPNRPK